MQLHIPAVKVSNLFSCWLLPVSLLLYIGVMFARSSKSQNPQAALNSGTYIGGAIVIAAAAYLSNSLFGSLDAFWAIAAGLLVGMIIGKITEIYTSADFGSVKKIAQQSETGPATTIIAGLAVGMYSTFWPMLSSASA